MPSPKKWLQPSAHGDKSGGADSGVDSGATGSQVEEAALEEKMPGTAEKQLEGTSVAGDPNEGIDPNAGMVENAEGERRAASVSPKPGEKRNWDETGGIDRELGATVLRVLLGHGYQLSTELSGEVAPLEKVKNKISDGPSSMDGGDLLPSSGSAGKKVQEPQEVNEMHPDEILELEAVIQEEREQENAQLEQLRLEADAFLKGSEAPMVDSEWEMHFQDGRPYYYNIATQRSQWECPEGFINTVGEAMADGRATVSVKEKGKNKVSIPLLELGSMTSRPSSESVRALQGSVDSVNKEFSSTVGDSGLRGGKAAETSGSLREDRISGFKTDMAGEHLDREGIEALSEGDAAVKSVDPEDKIPNVEVNAVSATEEQVVDEVSGIQEVGPGDEDDGGKRLCITTEKVSPSGAMDSAIQGKNEASGIAGDAVDLPEKKDEAWSANEVRANVPDGTWSAEEARDGTCS